MIGIDGVSYYTIKETAEALGVSDRTVRRYIQNDTLQAVKIKRFVYVSLDSINSYFDIREAPEAYGVKPFKKLTNAKIKEINARLEHNMKRYKKVNPITIDEVKNALELVQEADERTIENIERLLTSYQLMDHSEIDKILCFYYLGLLRGLEN